MAVVSTSGSRIVTGLVSSPSVLADPGEGGGKKRTWCETIETSAADSMTSTYHMARLPSNARIFGSSKISHDALGATTATIGVGLYPIRSGDFTASTTALNTGIVASTVGTKDLIADRANWGKRLWEYAGLSADPKCDMDVKLLLESATAHLSSGAGTITVEIDYATD